MADIYDLVQQKLREGQAGPSQFTDPTAGIGFEIAKMVKSNQDRRDIANKDALTNISSLIGKVTTPEGMANISSSLDKLSRESGGSVELDTNIAILKNINQTSLENYNMYKDGIDRGLDYVDSDSFPKEEKDYLNLDQIALNAGFSNEDGTGNTIKYLYAEKEKIHSYMDKIGLGFDGKTKKFNYSKGMDSSVIRKLQRHSGQIDIAIKTLAGDGIITKEEAYHIMVGDSAFYAEDRALALAEAKSIYGDSMKSSRKLGILIDKTRTDSLDDDDFLSLESYGINGKSLSEVEGGLESILESLTGIQNNENDRATVNNQKYKNWAGRYLDPIAKMGTIISDDDPPKVDPGPREESVEGEGTYDAEGNLIVDEEGEPAEGEPAEEEPSKTVLEPSKHISEFTVLPQNKTAPGSINERGEDFIAWKNKFMEETGWGIRWTNMAVARLKPIWKLEQDKIKYPKRATEIQAKIDKKTKEFTEWMQKPGFTLHGPSLADKMKKKSADELTKQANAKPRGSKKQGTGNQLLIQAAKDELKRRAENKKV